MNHAIDPKNPLPRYYQVYKSLKARIEGGEFVVDDALPPERQLVNDYNVSRITIVKALDLLEKDELIRREHGRGTFINKLRATENAETIAFITGVMLHPYIYSVLMGAARVTTELGYTLSVIGLSEDGMDTDSALRQIDTQNVIGVLTYPRPAKKDLKLYQGLQARGIPLVMIDRYYEEVRADYVVFDEEVASYEMTHSLIERGHKRIAVVTHYEVDTTSIHNRIRGYRRALEDAGLYRDELIWFDVYADLHISKGQIGSRKNTEILKQRLKNDKVTALVAVNHDVAERLNYDLMMINVDNARDDAVSHGEISIDIAAFAYRDMRDFSAYNVITGLQLGEDLGSRAASVLIDRATGRLSDETVQINIPIQILSPEDSPNHSSYLSVPEEKGGD